MKKEKIDLEAILLTEHLRTDINTRLKNGNVLIKQPGWKHEKPIYYE
jgi:hypothetical protein